MKPTVSLTYGLPGSGKTTSIQPLIDAGAKRVSLDDLRSMFRGQAVGDWDQKLENTVQELACMITAGLVAEGFDVVVDNCHVNPNIPDKLRRILAGKVKWAIIDRTNMPLEKCIEYDAGRDHPVGVVAIRQTQQKMARQQAKGYYLSVEYMEAWERSFEPYVADTTKPRAVIVDVDGTLSDAAGVRGPYETGRYERDGFHEDVASVVWAVARAHSAKVVVMSGRDEDFGSVTAEWLHRWRFSYDEFLLRPHGDTRRDSIVKAELFDKYIRHKYNVIAVFDDRDQVVNECWRAMGLRCYQVAAGTF